jgi:hypothetical protein
MNVRNSAVLLPVGAHVQSDARRIRGTAATDHLADLNTLIHVNAYEKSRGPSRAVIVAVRPAHPVDLAE